MPRGGCIQFPPIAAHLTPDRRPRQDFILKSKDEVKTESYSFFFYFIVAAFILHPCFSAARYVFALRSENKMQQLVSGGVTMKISAVSIFFVLLTATAFTFAQEPTKTPLTFEGKYSGCATVFVYRISEDKKKVVVVEANRGALNLSETPQTFDIGSSKNLDVYIDDYEKARQWWPYCTDEVDSTSTKPARIPATSGKVTIYISKSSEPPSKYLYRVTVELKDVSFKPAGDSFYYLEKTEMKDVLVGWLLG